LEPDQPQLQQTSQTAPVYGVITVLISAALATFALFLVDVAAKLLPPRPQDPLWLLQAAMGFVNILTVPLAGVMFLHLAAALAPLKDLGELFRTWASRVATVLALFFLLLLPLLGFATWRGINNVQAAVQQEVKLINLNADRVRVAINKASTPKELQQFMAEQKGPRVNVEEFNIPLATLKKSKLLLVDQVQTFYTNQIPGIRNQRFYPIYMQTLRTSALALAGSAGFAALAWNPKRQQSLLKTFLEIGAKTNSRITSKFNRLRPVPDEEVRNSRLMQKSRNTQHQTMLRNKREMEKSERQQKINFEKLQKAREKQQKQELERQRKLDSDRKN
jgi:hypothetical protein